MCRTLLTLSAAVLLSVAKPQVADMARAAEPDPKTVTLVCPSEADVRETLAGREVRRYVYLRTGELLPLFHPAAQSPRTLPPVSMDAGGHLVVLASKHRPVLNALSLDPQLKTACRSLGPQQYLLKTVRQRNRRVLLVVGGDGLGTLYGAYRLAEHLGVRFFLHGDAIPDERIAWKLPELDETGRPLFELRGVNPWGSHPFGFDLWNADDYKSHLAQLAKMRMNFLGVHCYPEGHPYAEPTVWLGLAGDFDDRGRVRLSYPSRYYNTLWRGRWGPIPPRKTGEYHFGGRLLFERDDWGPDVMLGHCPSPTTPEACNQVFNRTGTLLREAFAFAKLVGVKTCLGTEAPMIMPKALQERLKSQGKDPADPAVVQQVYEGIFRRIIKTHPLDYYWIWTPEGWTWRGNSPQQLDATVADLRIARAALEKVAAPFKLATCGWVLGPQADRAALDRMVSKQVAMAAISRGLGHEPIDPAFGQVTGRAKWAIPWLEGDDRLASPQLWVKRSRKDAADALAYGCTGLMGLQWRTRILGPNVSALAQAGWDQTGWNPRPGKLLPNTLPDQTDTEGALGGKAANYPGREIKGTDDDPIYQTCRYDLRGYHLDVPNGSYRVTLKFCEPHFNAANMRVCDVKLQGETVIERLDIFAKVGQFAALDYSLTDVKVTGGRLKLDIVHRKSLPCISAIVIEGENLTRKINCGGPAYRDYLADSMSPATTGRGTPRGLPAGDFYTDWATAMFGPEVAGPVAKLFEKLDGRLPQSLQGSCPAGSLSPIDRPWQEVAEDYAFIDELIELRGRVKGLGSVERFDYWLDNFRYMRSQARVRCVFGEFNRAMKQIAAEKDSSRRKALAAERALPLFGQLVQHYGEMYGYLLSTVNTPGGLATVINLEQNARFRPGVIERPAEQLSELLGGPLPADVQGPKEYRGRPRIIVPTLRSILVQGEVLTLKVIILSAARSTEATLFYRKMGPGPYTKIPLRHVARGVYTVTFPPDGADSDLEYHIEAITPTGQRLRFPATVPAMNQTLVTISTP